MEKKDKKLAGERIAKLRKEIDRHRYFYPHTNYVLLILKAKKMVICILDQLMNLKRRLAMHNSGKIHSTNTRKPLCLIYYEAYKSETDARKREHNLKLRSRAFAQLMKRIQESLSK